MKNVFVIIFCILAICFISVGFINSQKSSLNTLVSEIKPTPGFETAFTDWTAKYGKSSESIQFYKLAELATILNQHALIINRKADVNDVVLK